MRTVKISTIILGTVVFLNIECLALNVQDIKNDTTTKTQKAKIKEMKSDSKKSVDSRLTPRAYDNPDWTRKNNNEEYQRSKIRTH